MPASTATVRHLRILIGGFDAVSHTEPRVQSAHVELDGVRTQLEPSGDLLVALALRDQAEDLALTWAEFQRLARTGKRLLPSRRA